MRIGRSRSVRFTVRESAAARRKALPSWLANSPRSAVRGPAASATPSTTESTKPTRVRGCTKSRYIPSSRRRTGVSARPITRSMP